MFFNRFNFLIKDFTVRNSARPEIDGVFVSSKETVATDSFKIIRVSSVKANSDDFPVIPHKPKLKKDFKAFILPSEKASDVLKLFKSKSSVALPILDNAVVMRRNKTDVEVGKTDLESYNSVLSKIIQGQYPQYNEIFQEQGKYIEVSVNPTYLTQIAKFFSSFVNDNNIKELKIRVPVNPDKPVIFSGRNVNTGQTAEALLMPIKTE
jgi:hypothetical protein